MTIEHMKSFDIKTLKALYRINRWDAYLKDMTQFRRMFENSTAVYGAYELDELTGLVRVLSDDAHILYIQDIIVHPDHLRKGIGKALMDHVLNVFGHVRQKVLLTDGNSKSVHAFYRRFGFKEVSEKGLASFVRLD